MMMDAEHEWGAEWQRAKRAVTTLLNAAERAGVHPIFLSNLQRLHQAIHIGAEPGLRAIQEGPVEETEGDRIIDALAEVSPRLAGAFMRWCGEVLNIRVEDATIPLLMQWNPEIAERLLFECGVADQLQGKA